MAAPYGERVAVQDVRLALRPGAVPGLPGPNGAGQSTTVGMVCGPTVPDAGRVSLAPDEADCKRRIGLVPQDIALYEAWPARMNLGLCGALYGMATLLMVMLGFSLAFGLIAAWRFRREA